MSAGAIETPVLIAGGGPVGVVLAMDLAWRGIRSVVLERRRAIPPNPRCNTTNSRTMEILRRLGCAEAARDAGLPDDYANDVAYMTRMNGYELTRYKWRTRNEMRQGVEYGIGVGWPTPEPILHISQLYLEPVLRRHAVAHFGVDLREGLEITGFRQDAEAVTAEARDVQSGDTVTFRSRFLVGADGSNSLVRRTIGARLTGTAALQNTCTTFMRAPRLGALNRSHPTWMYRFLAGRHGGVLVAIDGRDLWLFHCSARGRRLTAPEAEEALFDAIGERFDYEILNQVHWTARALVANKFCEGRVFLAGDAAHIWIPMGGFGMNAGVADAASIGWMLSGVLQGWLDPRILDAYELERAPVGGQVAQAAVGISRDLAAQNRYDPILDQPTAEGETARQERGRLISAANRSEFGSVGMQLGYCYAGSPIICADDTPPPPFALDRYVESSWPGARAPHLWRAGSGRALYDDFGKGFALLRIGDAAPGGQGLIDAANRRRVPLIVLALAEPEALVKYEGYRLVLVRPDQHVAWRGMADPGDADAVLDRITGRLMRERPVLALEVRDYARLAAPARALLATDEGLVLADSARTLWLVAGGGRRHSLAAVPGAVLGLARLPDGKLVAATPNALLEVAGGAAAPYVDLSGTMLGLLGGLAADAAGNLYVIDRGMGELGAHIIRVDTERRVHVVLDGIAAPEAIVWSPDGPVLLLLEGPRGRVKQCRIAEDGALGEARPLIDLGTAVNAIAADRGGIWLCGADASITRFDHAGRMTARSLLPEGAATSCAASVATAPELYIAGDVRAPDGGWLARVRQPPA